MFSGIFLSSFMIRIIGDYEYGLYQTMAAFVNYLVILEFGTGTVMSRNLLVARNSNDKSLINKSVNTVFSISLFLSILIVLVGLIFYFNIENIYSKTIHVKDMGYCKFMFLVMLIYLICSYFSQTFSGVFLGFENYVLKNIINISKITTRIILIVSVLCFYNHVIAIALIDMILSMVIVIFSVVYCIRKYKISFRPKYLDIKIIKSSLPMCFALLLQALINQSNGNVDKFVISVKMSMGSVALYSVAMYIYNIISSVTTTPISMYMPQVAKNIGKGLKGTELTETLIPPARLSVLIGGTIMFGFISVGKQFIQIMYGKDYEFAWIIALIIIAPMFIDMTLGVVINVLDMLNKRHIRSLILSITLIINIVLTVLLIDCFGIIGAAVATAVSLILGNILLLDIYYSKVIKIKVLYLYKEAYRGIIPALVLAMIIGGTIAYIIPNKYFSFFIGGITFVVIELVGLLKFKSNSHEKQMIVSALSKIFKRK